MNLNEKLITLVQLHPCLYDCRNKEYKNSYKKEILWEQISKELNESCDAIKTKWKNLKDGYTKYKKNTKGTTRQKNTYVNWIWGPYLTFLDCAKQPRRTGSNVVAANANDLLTIKNEVQLPSRSPSSSCASVNASPPPTTINTIDDSLTNPLPFTPLNSSRKRGYTSEEDSFDKVVAYLSNKETKDSIDLLFESYAKTLKKMKPRTQSTIKLQIAQIFADAEIADQQLENTIAICKTEP